MKVAALYDIHGNTPALEAVIAEVGALGVDRIVVGGDVVPGPMPRETLDVLSALDSALDIPVDFIYGNGERAVLAMLAGDPLPHLPESVREVIRWTADQLSAEQREWISTWPATLRVTIPDLGEVLFCHATPRDENEIFTARTAVAVLEPLIAPLGVSVVVCGHTHMQFDREIGSTRVVNAGSIGMPFGDPGAHWAQLGPTIQLRRLDYAREAAADRIRASDYPEAVTFADVNLLDPPSEDAMLETFERSALR